MRGQLGPKESVRRKGKISHFRYLGPFSIVSVTGCLYRAIREIRETRGETGSGTHLGCLRRLTEIQEVGTLTATPFLIVVHVNLDYKHFCSNQT